MRIANTFVVPAAKTQVMKFFSDIPKVAQCVPGCEDVVAITKTKYQAKMVLQLKLLKLKFDVEGERTKLSPGHIEAVTTGRPLSIGGGIETKLVADMKKLGPKQTEISYAMESLMNGKLAAIGELVMKKTLAKNAQAFEQNVIAVFE